MSNKPIDPRRIRYVGINNISVSGYKSIQNEQTVTIAPLTIFAGANSAGKSSVIQPLLLLKQTLEAPYDPGALLLDGANVRFTQAKQLFYKGGDSFQIELHATNNQRLKLHFSRKNTKTGLQLVQMDYSRAGYEITLNPNMQAEEISRIVERIPERDRQIPLPLFKEINDFKIVRNRCFLEIRPYSPFPFMRTPFAELIQSTIHLPGLRGNPERTYPVSAVGDTFPGTFDRYTASIIAKWQEEKSPQISKLGEQLMLLGLTWKVVAKRIDDTKVELRVARTPTPRQGGANDMVSVADVGFGVSQTLPVLVALLTAKPGQLVYLEQPEIHLHPRAQVAMAKVLADAAKRNVRIVVETHSSLLLLAVQTLIAEGYLPQNIVKLHWFRRSEQGETTITTGELDETGAFGDWPEDFGEVALDAEQRYLDAAEMILIKGNDDSREKE